MVILTKKFDWIKKFLVNQNPRKINATYSIIGEKGVNLVESGVMNKKESKFISYAILAFAFE
ncbi:19794_t:CDS:2 [Gigaspora rosea]|nr:19794_t:CDS:2 [Gigaspora rosea]